MPPSFCNLSKSLTCKASRSLITTVTFRVRQTARFLSGRTRQKCSPSLWKCDWQRGKEPLITWETARSKWQSATWCLLLPIHVPARQTARFPSGRNQVSSTSGLPLWCQLLIGQRQKTHLAADWLREEIHTNFLKTSPICVKHDKMLKSSVGRGCSLSSSSQELKAVWNNSWCLTKAADLRVYCCAAIVQVLRTGTGGEVVKSSRCRNWSHSKWAFFVQCLEERWLKLNWWPEDVCSRGGSPRYDLSQSCPWRFKLCCRWAQRWSSLSQPPPYIAFCFNICLRVGSSRQQACSGWLHSGMVSYVS